MSVSESAARARTASAVCLVLAPLLLLVSTFLMTPYGEDQNAYLDALAAAPTTNMLGALAFLAGTLLFVPGLIGVIRLLRGPRGAVGQVGAGLVLAGALINNWFWASAIEVEAAAPGRDRAQMIALFQGLEASAWGLIGAVAFLGGIALGSILLAVGVVLRRAAPVWAPMALVLAVAANFVPLGRWAEVAAFALLTVGFTGLALGIARVPAEHWARWQPLGERPGASDGGDPAPDVAPDPTARPRPEGSASI
jgi:hypothetical protein